MRLLLLGAVLVVLHSPAIAEDLAPGVHKNVATEDPGQTFNVFLPKVYGERTEEAFPAVFISSAEGNPNFHGLEAWAEAHEVILVTINGSRNGPWEPIHAAQKAVTAAAFKQLRVHHCLRFSMGNRVAATRRTRKGILCIVLGRVGSWRG